MPALPPLAVDVREACRERRTGKGQWTLGFTAELMHRGMPLTLLADDGPLPANWEAYAERLTRLPGDGFTWHPRARGWLRRHSEMLYVSPTSYIVPAFPGPPVACMPVVHDLIAFRGEPHQRRAVAIERITLPRALQKARHVLAASDSTRRDLLARFSFLRHEDVTAVYAGPHAPSPAPNVSDGRTILCIATLCPRKNQLRLIQAYASLPESLRARWRLLLAGGRGWSDESIVRAAVSTPGVGWEKYVSDEEYEELLRTCAMFALPSLYEGFGMQILDALQRGIPVLTSDRGSLREVAGEAACIVDPESVDSIASGLRSILADPAYADELRAKGPAAAQRYSWAHTVDLFLGAAERAMSPSSML